MPGFLNVNGFAVPVALDSLKRPAAEELGTRERMLDGSLYSHRSAKKRRLECELPPMTEAEALEAYEGLLRGDGHVWSFDASLYSSKGLGPNAGYAASQSGSGGKYSGKLTLNATNGTIAFPAQLGARWTVMVWRHEGGAWRHYVIRSDGAKWVNGVRNDIASTSWLSMAGGAVTLTNTAGAAQDYDDLVALPFLVAQTWPAIVAASSRPFPPLPRLEVYGDALLGSSASAPVTMMGEVGEATYVPARIGGAFDRTIQRLSVTLREV